MQNSYGAGFWLRRRAAGRGPPNFKRNPTTGGPGNETTCEIVAILIENTVQTQTDKSENNNTGWETIKYSRSNPEEIKLSWRARLFFKKGEFSYKRYDLKFWSIFSWIFGLAFITLSFVYVEFLSLIMPKPITTQSIVIIILMIAIPYWVWFGKLVPFFRLFDDRIRDASDSMLSLEEKEAQLEFYKEGDIRVIRIVRYSSDCSICGAEVYLDDGSPDFPRRMVGRCAESPREHVFSFDRVTRKGAVLRSPPL